MCWGSIRQLGRIWPTEPAHHRQNPKTWSLGVVVDGNMWQPRRWSFNTGRSCSLTSHRAQVRSQARPGAGMALSAVPTHHLTRIPLHLFRVMLLRRLRFPLPLSLHTCRCGRQIDKFGHHRASCARTGALGRRGFALESATARVCREAGGKVTTNVMVRDLDLDDPRAAAHTEEQRTWMGWFCTELAARRSEHT